MDPVIIKLVIIKGWPYQRNHGGCYDVTAAFARHLASIFHPAHAYLWLYLVVLQCYLDHSLFYKINEQVELHGTYFLCLLMLFLGVICFVYFVPRIMAETVMSLLCVKESRALSNQLITLLRWLVSLENSTLQKKSYFLHSRFPLGHNYPQSCPISKWSLPLLTSPK